MLDSVSVFLSLPVVVYGHKGLVILPPSSSAYRNFVLAKEFALQAHFFLSLSVNCLKKKFNEAEIFIRSRLLHVTMHKKSQFKQDAT